VYVCLPLSWSRVCLSISVRGAEETAVYRHRHRHRHAAGRFFANGAVSVIITHTYTHKHTHRAHRVVIDHIMMGAEDQDGNIVPGVSSVDHHFISQVLYIYNIYFMYC
jgi:hypothetical protein